MHCFVVRDQAGHAKQLFVDSESSLEDWVTALNTAVSQVRCTAPALSTAGCARAASSLSCRAPC